MVLRTTDLFNSKKECCGCSACMNACPKGAITMKEDEYGFIYPDIDEQKCIDCGSCKRACSLQTEASLKTPTEGYAVYNTDTEMLMQSSSGGAFSALASEVLKSGGVVYGAAWEREDHQLVVRHIGICDVSDLKKLQGSKYVQSDMGDVFRQVKKMLQADRKVLFSGTPCQVAGLYQFLKKDYDNLYTVDVICHGVPNGRMFNDYLQTNSINADKLSFRDKKKGWEDFYIHYFSKQKSKHIHWRVSSFYNYFINMKIFRESCYSCRYAGRKRVSDLTIGDYWGIRQSHPELLKEEEWHRGIYNGISCVLVNTEKGKKLLEKSEKIVKRSSSVELVSRHNGQLNRPSKYPADRDEILELYRTKGYRAVEKKFRKDLGSKRYYYKLKSSIPKGLVRKVKHILGKSD